MYTRSSTQSKLFSTYSMPKHTRNKSSVNSERIIKNSGSLERNKKEQVFSKISKNHKSRSSQKSQKSIKSQVRGKSHDIYSLAPLAGYQIKKAPKIYYNQIFCDVYDEKGNHDRILDTSANKSTDQVCDYISSDLLELPSMGRNLFNNKRILFF